MRRKDRELPLERAIDIMLHAPYCVLSTSPSCVKDFDMETQETMDDQKKMDYQIFSIPISYVYHDNCLYIHTATKGRKIVLKESTLVCGVCWKDSSA